MISFLLIFLLAAPELLEAGDTTIQQAAVAGYGPPVDIWSLGVLLFTALTNSTPFPQIDETEKGKAELKNCIRKGEFKFDNPIWKSISPEGNKRVYIVGK
jgi:serine/threonine protein kinase